MSGQVSTVLLRRRRALTDTRFRRRRTGALAALAATALVAAAWWLLTGPPVALSRVVVSGYGGPDRRDVLEQAREAASGGTVVSLPGDPIRRALLRFPWVADVSVSHDWLRGVRVRVTTARPAAIVETSDGRAAEVSGEGRVLGAAEGGAKLPHIASVGGMPRDGGWLAVGDRGALAAVVALAGQHLSERVAEVHREPSGLVGLLNDGPELRLGSAERLPDKARALAAVLRKGLPGGTSYIDVSIPGRPVVMVPPPPTATSSTSGGLPGGSTSDPGQPSRQG